MLQDIPLASVLFIDIETVSGHATFDDADDSTRELWREKARYWLKDYPVEEEAPALCYRDRAAILAEFGKVVCISVGLLGRASAGEEGVFRLKSYAGDDEFTLLSAFAALLNQHFADPSRYWLCGHNLKEFDVPYLCRRMMMHGIPLPALLQISGKKPWEVRHLLDTLELWKFGDIKHYTSLKLLAHCLGVPSPKDDLDGSQVGRVYYQEQDLEAIVRYCERDVLAVAQVVRRMMGLPLIAPEAVQFSS